MFKFKDLSLVQKAGLVVWGVGYAAFMGYIIKATKDETNEISKLTDMIAEESERLTKGL